MSAKRILLLTSEYSPSLGGIGTYAREIAEAAAGLGAEVTLLAPNYGESKNTVENGVNVLRFPGGLHSFRDVPRKFLTAWTSAAPGFDIVHAADWPFYLPISYLPRSRAQSRFVTLHGTEANQMRRPKRHFILNLCGWSSRIDHFLCNSHYTKDLLVSSFPETHNRAKVTLLGVAPFWFGETRDRASLRRDWDIKDDEFAIITVGRLTPRKGHLATLAALNKLPEALRAKIVWLITGPAIEGDYVSTLQQAIELSPIRVRLLGSQTNHDLRGLYALADLFCLNAEQAAGKVEGFGLVYLEAGAAGLPSVATRIGGVPDAVVAGYSGLLCEPGSQTELTSAIERCLSDSSFRQILAANARDYAHKLSWLNCAATTYDFPYSNS